MLHWKERAWHDDLESGERGTEGGGACEARARARASEGDVSEIR